MKSFEIIEKRKADLLTSLDQIDDDKLTYHPDEGKWNIIQIIQHVADAERGALNYCQKKIQAGDKMPNSPLGENARMILFNKFLKTKVRYKMPKGLKSPEDGLEYQEVCVGWYNTREALRKFLDSYPEKYLKKAIFKHPVAGRIGLNNMLLFFDAHLIHHKFQIERNLKSFQTL
ncbi:MAG: DinB family protein [Cyclobacteriaceae bacterium]